MSNRVSGGFGAMLRQLREAAGLTQGQLAERAGMHAMGVAKLEQGHREPSWASVRALADALGVSCEAFTQESVDLPPPTPGRPRKQLPPEKPPAQTGRPRKQPPAEPPPQHKPRGRRRPGARG